jgi:hypothetical protein
MPPPPPHHPTASGIEKQDVFLYDFDRNSFLDRLGAIIDKSGSISSLL